MQSVNETTLLLHSPRERDDIVVDESHCAKIVTLSSNDKDIEVNEVISDTSSDDVDSSKISTSSLIQVVAVLMIGLFTSNLDTSLVLATHPRIASEFDALEESSWLFVSFLLGGVVTQILYAKLSDVYGRMVMLVFCYALFGTGCAIIGMSQSMGGVIFGRVMSGSGGAGMAGLVLVITTDLIPLREVASWLGYINIVSMTARSIGGPVGGFLADQIGWRWSFLGQAPLIGIAIVASIFVVPNTKAPELETRRTGLQAWLARIDFAGSLLLGTGLLLFMLPIQIGGVKVPWTHPLIFGLFGGGILLLGIFVINEARWAEEPAFPLRLIKHRDVLSSYLAITCIVGAQTSLMYFVPIYFQITTAASNTVVGLHLVPAVVGNAVGGLVAGYFIRTTGGYKAVIVGSSVFASIGYCLLIIRWLGDTNIWESMYIALGGFGAGMATSAVFVSLNAVVEPIHKAVVTSGLQIAMPIGMLLGVAAGSAVMVQVLQKVLATKLLEIGLGPESRAEIIEKSIANVDYIKHLPENLSHIVVGGYVVALRASFAVILAFSVVGLVAGCFLRERRL